MRFDLDENERGEKKRCKKDFVTSNHQPREKTYAEYRTGDQAGEPESNPHGARRRSTIVGFSGCVADGAGGFGKR